MHFVQSMSHLLFLGVLANESQNLYCSIPALVLFFITERQDEQS